MAQRPTPWSSRQATVNDPSVGSRQAAYPLLRIQPITMADTMTDNAVATRMARTSKRLIR